ncbi:hypothetical protein [Cupriavidus sp. 8B]
MTFPVKVPPLEQAVDISLLTLCGLALVEIPAAPDLHQSRTPKRLIAMTKIMASILFGVMAAGANRCGPIY